MSVLYPNLSFAQLNEQTKLVVSVFLVYLFFFSTKTFWVYITLHVDHSVFRTPPKSSFNNWRQKHSSWQHWYSSSRTVHTTAGTHSRPFIVPLHLSLLGWFVHNELAPNCSSRLKYIIFSLHFLKSEFKNYREVEVINTPESQKPFFYENLWYNIKKKKKKREMENRHNFS